jgi:hypothetical protein
VGKSHVCGLVSEGTGAVASIAGGEGGASSLSFIEGRSPPYSVGCRSTRIKCKFDMHHLPEVQRV